MANGTMTSCQEYYEDDVTYTGETGSSTNPYACEDVFDFCNSGAYNGTSDSDLKYIKQVNNIDFNYHPTYKKGIDGVKIVEAPYAVFNSDIKHIRNVVLKNYAFGASNTSFAFKFKKVINSQFFNVVLINCGEGNSQSQSWINAEIDNCNFGISMLAPKDFCGIIPGNAISNSTINLKGCLANGKAYNFQSKQLNRVHLNFDSVLNYYQLWENTNFDSCYITGIIRYGYISTTYTPPYIFDYGTISNSYFAHEFVRDIDDIRMLTHSVTFNGTSFYDKELSGINLSDNGNMKFLTTEQCKSVDYLQSIGFSVVPVEVN